MNPNSTQAQFDYLHAEIAFLTQKNQEIPPFLFAFVKHCRQFYWSVTRLLGLSRLHDGSKIAQAAKAANGFDFLDDVDLWESAAKAGPTLYMDATSAARSGAQSGVPRVVRELCRYLTEADAGVPVQLKNGAFVYLNRDAPVAFKTGDRLALLDANWIFVDEFAPVIAQLAQQGVEIILGLYDLIPITHPGFVSPQTLRYFSLWLEKIAPHASAILAISQNTAEAFEAYAAQNALPLRAGCRLGWFRIGADFILPQIAPVSQEAQAVRHAGQPFFLTVSTLEPRKGHATALAAFDALWAQGGEAHYVIVGRKGWSVEALSHRILNHPEYGQRLHWLQNASDVDLAALYQDCRALIMPSFAEGFGLPVAEAGFYGAPVIASDLPVFHETGGDEIVYFPSADAKALQRRIFETLAAPRRSPAICVASWRESGREFVNIIQRRAYQRILRS